MTSAVRRQATGYVLGHSASVALLARDALTSVAEEAIAKSGASEPLRARIVLEGEREAWESFSALLDHPDSSEPAIAIGSDDPAQVLHTSGTESRPKGAVLARELRPPRPVVAAQRLLRRGDHASRDPARDLRAPARLRL